MKNESKKVSKNVDTFEHLKNGPPFRLDRKHTFFENVHTSQLKCSILRATPWIHPQRALLAVRAFKRKFVWGITLCEKLVFLEGSGLGDLSQSIRREIL